MPLQQAPAQLLQRALRSLALPPQLTAPAQQQQQPAHLPKRRDLAQVLRRLPLKHSTRSQLRRLHKALQQPLLLVLQMPLLQVLPLALAQPTLQAFLPL